VNSKLRTQILSASLLVALIGCTGGPRASVPAESAGGSPPVAAPPRGDDGSTSNPPVGDRYNWTTGATVDIQVDSLEVLEAYMQRPVNLPVGATVTAKLNVDLKDLDASSGQGFGGTIKVAFEESLASGGLKYNEQKFATGTSLPSLVYNKFVTVPGKNHFQSFAQDRFGGVILVVDQVDDLGLMSGQVYFRNFLPATIQQGPLEYCWMIKRGPYDCRDYLVNRDENGDSTNDEHKKVIDPNSSIYPNRFKDGNAFYTKLGSFSLMNGQKALNQ
jgi:hypothetical protein